MTQYILRESKVVYKNYKKVKDLQFKTPSIIFEWFEKRFKNTPFEQMISIYLNAANQVICFDVIAEGEVDQAVVYMRKIARCALLNMATRVILTHNHPSGVARPSEHDIAITKRIQECLQALEIELLDHVVIGDKEYYSFREHGLV